MIVRRCAASLVALFGILLNSVFAGEPETLPDGIYAEFTTPRGTITSELFFEKAPLTVASFVGLAEGTLGPAPRKPYFDNLTFHRVATGFVVQGGDPLGTGEGGPGYRFPDEFVPGLRHDSPGILSMANSGSDSNGSQFFFTLAPVNRLNYLHNVFGRTVRGLEVLPQIKAGDTMTVKIIRRGKAAESFQSNEASFAKLLATAKRAIPPAFDDVSGLLQTDPPRAKALDTKLSNFARFTGIRLHGRLFDRFEPSFPSQTAAQFVAALGANLPLSPNGALVVWFAGENQWHLHAPTRPELKIPDLQPWPTPSQAIVSSPELLVAENRRRMLAKLNEVVDSLIYQLEGVLGGPGASK